jgi:hypothetical protein
MKLSSALTNLLKQSFRQTDTDRQTGQKGQLFRLRLRLRLVYFLLVPEVTEKSKAAVQHVL